MNSAYRSTCYEYFTLYTAILEHISENNLIAKKAISYSDLTSTLETLVALIKNATTFEKTRYEGSRRKLNLFLTIKLHKMGHIYQWFILLPFWLIFSWRHAERSIWMCKVVTLDGCVACWDCHKRRRTHQGSITGMLVFLQIRRQSRCS